jgi:NADPH:quinone reductase-like Zn-dependent oxidoreductase
VSIAGLGGIGSLLLQLLKPVFGAGKVITTLSTTKVPLLSSVLGEGLVDQIVDYTKEDVIKEIGLKTVDVLFDTIFLSMSYLPVMKPGGLEVAFIGKSGKTLKKDWPEVPWIIQKLADLIDAQWKWRASRWGVRYQHTFTDAAKENSEAIDRWAKEGKLKAIIGGVTEMNDIETAKKFYDIVGSQKGAVGKYVIKIS